MSRGLDQIDMSEVEANEWIVNRHYFSLTTRLAAAGASPSRKRKKGVINFMRQKG